MGYLSDEIEQVDEVEYQREVRAYHAAERARRNEEAIDLEFESEPSAIKTGLVSGAKTLLLQFATALQQPNRALTAICGDDKILLRIYQATIIAAGILIAGFVLNVVGRSAGWF